MKCIAGLKLYDGDIVLSEEQKSLLHSHEDSGDKTSNRQARAVVMLSSEKWLDGVVPYVLSDELSEYYQSCCTDARHTL